MDQFTAEKLRNEIVNPLALLTAELTSEAMKLEEAYAKKRVTRPWLPLNEAGALRAIKVLKKFLRDEVKSKREDAEEGTLRYREAELKFKKATKADKKS
ncbi:MAG TPA: hypothetical protein VMV10_10025 [Pirellulales bacterium]|nr:hypothetical protein [Pirellulales bacterium]